MPSGKSSTANSNLSKRLVLRSFLANFLSEIWRRNGSLIGISSAQDVCLLRTYEEWSKQWVDPSRLHVLILPVSILGLAGSSRRGRLVERGITCSKIARKRRPVL